MFTTVRMSGGAVHSSVRLWLRLEGLMALLLATYLYAHVGGTWPVFAVLFFAPDVSFAGYIAGPRIGAALYNLAHSYVGPLILAAALLSAGIGVPLALVWGAHIGFDRALGYGLKYPSAFGDTHLGPIGRASHEEALILPTAHRGGRCVRTSAAERGGCVSSRIRPQGQSGPRGLSGASALPILCKRPLRGGEKHVCDADRIHQRGATSLHHVRE